MRYASTTLTSSPPPLLVRRWKYGPPNPGYDDLPEGIEHISTVLGRIYQELSRQLDHADRAGREVWR